MGGAGTGTRAGPGHRLWGLQEQNHGLPVFHGVERLQLVLITPDTRWAVRCKVLLLFAPGALLEKKVDVDKRGLGVTDYNGVVTKALGCRPPVSKDSSGDRPTFLDKV